MGSPGLQRRAQASQDVREAAGQARDRLGTGPPTAGLHRCPCRWRWPGVGRFGGSRPAAVSRTTSSPSRTRSSGSYSATATRTGNLSWTREPRRVCRGSRPPWPAEVKRIARGPCSALSWKPRPPRRRAPLPSLSGGKRRHLPGGAYPRRLTWADERSAGSGAPTSGRSPAESNRPDNGPAALRCIPIRPDQLPKPGCPGPAACRCLPTLPGLLRAQRYRPADRVRRQSTGGRGRPAIPPAADRSARSPVR